MEKAAINHASKALEDEPAMRWFSPPKVLVDNREGDFEPGCKSQERDAQVAREKNILQALYFNKAMTPPSPAEPDPEASASAADKRIDPVIIPLDDIENGDESVEDYSAKQWLDPKVNAVDRKASMESQFSLPPALSNLLNSVNLSNILTSVPPPTELSQEDQNTLAAQTEAMKVIKEAALDASFTFDFVIRSSTLVYYWSIVWLA